MSLIVGLLAAAAACESTEPALDLTAEARWAALGKSCPADAPATPLGSAARDALGAPLWRNTNTEWAEIALRVPGGWGGFFYDDGAATIYLVDPSQRAAAIAALGAEGLPIPTLAFVKQGRWDFAQMYDWYRYLERHVWAVDGVWGSDIQEGTNRLEYSVIDAATRTHVENVLTALDVPCFLVAIEIGPMPVAL